MALLRGQFWGDRHGSRQRAHPEGSQPSPELEFPTWVSPTPQDIPLLAKTLGFGERGASAED